MICKTCRQRSASTRRVFVPEDSNILAIVACSPCARKFATAHSGRVLSFDRKNGVWV